jgi:ubiquinone/menaquinone biosynthesis C-methylase UbiE
VGPSGTVCGIDAAAEMVTRATRKAERAGLDVAFRHAVIETLPYPDGQFDVVLSTLMMHHLPRDVRSAAAREIRRVLKPGGRVLVMDFGAGGQNRGGLLAHVHRHGGVGLAEIADLLRDAGLHPVESGPVGTRDLHFTLAQAPGGA